MNAEKKPIPEQPESPESYSPKGKPAILSMAEYLHGMNYPDKKVIEGIPHIKAQDPEVQENFQFCACMRSCMQYLCKGPSFDFIFFAGLTGALHFNIWDKNEPWTYMESVTGGRFPENNQAIELAFQAAGYECEIIDNVQEIQQNKEHYIKKIISSINEGYPVLTFGIVGPPTCSLITGYEKDGGALRGWSAFQEEDSQYFYTENGLDESTKLVFFTGKTKENAMNELAVSALKQIAHVSRMPETKDFAYGADAYMEWADALLRDKDFTADRQDFLNQVVDAHCGQKVIVMTGREYGAAFLSRLLPYMPQYQEQIEKACALSNEEKDILSRFWQLEPNFYFDSKQLLDPKYRRQQANIILEAREVFVQLTEVLRELEA